MLKQYSVLMSVYQKEKPEYFKAALDSMIQQTIPPAEVVLVCDGPLTKELDQVITGYEQSQPEFHVIRLAENRGLGNALSIGLAHCQYQWIARMDTDDVALKYRCEWQLAYLEQHPETDVISGTIAEFQGDTTDVEEIQKQTSSFKCLPEDHKALAKYLKYRNPVNHPCVMFRRSKAIEAGGYEPCLYFEDYDLWVRIYQKQGHFANLPEVIHYMRVNEMHQRRGGVGYAKAIIHFQARLYHYHVISLIPCIGITATRIAVSLMPNTLRKRIYEKRLRTIT